MKKIIALFLLLSALTGMLCSCTDYNVKVIGNYVVEESKTPTNYVRIVMKNGDAMLLELYPDAAPLTVEHFKGLVAEKYFDGITFHRVVKNFVIQGGDPDGDGLSNGDRPWLKGEFSANGYDNPIMHVRGVISMARRGNDYDSASTQFFIVHQTPNPAYNSLDGNYAAFGMLLAGYDVLDKIAGVATDSRDKPIKDQTMAEVRFVNIVEGK